MTQEERQSPRTVQTEQAPDTVYTDSTVEYTLPDYLPEIRRVLSVRTRVCERGQYTEQGRLECTGTCVHTLLYQDEAGKPAGVTVPSDYRFFVPLGEGEAVGTSVWSRPESVTARPMGPRRVSIRARVASRVRVYSAGEAAGAGMSSMGCECLTAEGVTRETRMEESDPLHLSETVSLGVGGECRLLSYDGAARIDRLQTGTEGLVCEGALCLTALCAPEVGAPFSVEAKIPFGVTFRGLTEPDALVSARGVCRELTAEPSVGEGGEGYLTFGAELAVLATEDVNRSISWPKDLYSTSVPTKVKHEQRTLWEAVAGGCLPVSAEVSVPVEQVGAEEAEFVISTTLDAGALSFREEEGRMLAETDGRVQMLLGMPGESGDGTGLFPVSFSVPLSFEVPFATSMPSDAHLEGELTVVSVQGRRDRDRLCAVVEGCLSARGARGRAVEMVESFVSDSDTPFEKKEGQLLAVYLKGGDSLWSLAKRYHTTAAELARLNQLPLSQEDSVGDPQLLDGYTRILIET